MTDRSTPVSTDVDRIREQAAALRRGAAARAEARTARLADVVRDVEATVTSLRRLVDEGLGPEVAPPGTATHLTETTEREALARALSRALDAHAALRRVEQSVGRERRAVERRADAMAARADRAESRARLDAARSRLRAGGPRAVRPSSGPAGPGALDVEAEETGERWLGAPEASPGTGSDSPADGAWERTPVGRGALAPAAGGPGSLAPPAPAEPVEGVEPVEEVELMEPSAWIESTDVDEPTAAIELGEAPGGTGAAAAPQGRARVRRVASEGGPGRVGTTEADAPVLPSAPPAEPSPARRLPPPPPDRGPAGARVEADRAPATVGPRVVEGPGTDADAWFSLLNDPDLRRGPRGDDERVDALRRQLDGRRGARPRGRRPARPGPTRDGDRDPSGRPDGTRAPSSAGARKVLLLHAAAVALLVVASVVLVLGLLHGRPAYLAGSVLLAVLSAVVVLASSPRPTADLTRSEVAKG